MTDQNEKKPLNLNARQERPFTVSLYSIYKTYDQLTHDMPVKAFQAVARKVDDLTKPMMTGHAAAITMPAGIIIRNAARVTHSATTNNNGYAITASLGGLAGAAAAWWIAGNAAFSAIAASTAGGTIGSIGVAIAAAVATSPIVIPAFTAALFTSATLLGAAAGGISVLGALKNIDIALTRSMDAFRGVKYDAETRKQIEASFDKDSLTAARQDKIMRDAQHALHSLRPEQRVALSQYLTKEFEEVATHQKAAAENTRVMTLAQKPGSGPRPV